MLNDCCSANPWQIDVTVQHKIQVCIDALIVPVIHIEQTLKVRGDNY